MDINRVCPFCMKQRDIEQATFCPNCGKKREDLPSIQHQLKPYSVLQGKYLVGNVLGEGGFGITYIGLDMNLEIRVAIKEFYPNGFVTRESNVTSTVTSYTGTQKEILEKWKENFLNEAKALAKCSDLAGVVGVKDYFMENGTAYIVQEYLEGKTLKDAINNNSNLMSFKELIQLLAPVMSALEEIHKQGTIHRDISPDNIMILNNGTMKVLDFGAARNYEEDTERSKSVLLKPGYAPEEQYRTKGKQGPWTDVYAMAATIYKCITGITPSESMERLIHDNLKMPSEFGVAITYEEEQVLRKGLAVDATQRYQSMKEFRDELLDSLHSEEQYANVDEETTQSQPTKVKKKNGGLIFLGIAVLFAIGTVIIGFIFFNQSGKEEQEEEEYTEVALENGTEAFTETTVEVGEQDYAKSEVNVGIEQLTPIDELCEEGKSKLNNGEYYEAMVTFQSAIDQYIPLYNNSQDELIRQKIQNAFDAMSEATLLYERMIKEVSVKSDVYQEILERLNKSIEYVVMISEQNIEVNADDLYIERQNLPGEFVEKYILAFNENVTSKEWRKEEAYYLMEDANSIDLVKHEEKNDPLTLRYNSALAWYTITSNESEIKNKHKSVYDILMNAFIETDYNFQILYYLSFYNDQMDYYYQTIVNLLRANQGIMIGTDIAPEEFWYFNDLEHYSIDDKNGVRNEYRGAIREFFMNHLNQ